MQTKHSECNIKANCDITQRAGKRVLPSDASKRQHKRKSSEAFHILATACAVSKNQDFFYLNVPTINPDSPESQGSVIVFDNFYFFAISILPIFSNVERETECG